MTHEIRVKPNPTFSEWAQSLNMVFSHRGPAILIQAFLTLFVAGLTMTVIETLGTAVSAVAILAAVCFAMYLILCSSLATSRRRAIFQALKNATRSYIFSDESIVTESQASTEKYSWDALLRVTETTSTHVLIFATFDTICIPKRDISSDEATAFAALLQSKLDSRGAKKVP